MKEIRSISNISSFAFFNKKEVFQKVNDLYFDNELLFTEVESFSVKDDLFFVYKYDKEKLLSFQFKEKDKIVYHSFSISPELCFGSTAFLRLNYNHTNKSYDYFLYDLSTNDIIQISNFDSSAVHHFIAYPQVYYKSNNQTSIGSFHLPTETTLWQYSVADLGAEKVSKILGVFGQTLVVVCKMPVYPEHILIGIDINNGKLLWRVNLPQYLMHSNLFYYEQNNSIISLRRNFLWEFSLSSMEVIREKQLPETFKYNTLNV